MANKTGPVQKDKTVAKRGNSAKSKKEVFGKWYKPRRSIRNVKT